METASHFVREQSTSTVADYSKRVYRLAGTYLGIVLAASVSILLILWHGKLFITLSQRSNVETLTLAVVLILFAYLVVVCLPGAWGAFKIMAYNLPGWLGQDRKAVEQRKQKALKVRQTPPDAVYLNCLVCREGKADAPLRLPLQDEAGSLGTIVIVGAKMTHEQAASHSSNSVFAFFEQRIQKLVQEREPEAEVQIVQWATIDDEKALQYDSLVRFSRNLEKHLGSDSLWPSIVLTDDDIATLTREGGELCPALRNESHLPDLEYQAEHRLPIIPEPLAFVSLSRQEQRADPMASMGCAFLVTLVILAILIVFIFLPPWTPSK
jgi:hypothetical protein